MKSQERYQFGWIDVRSYFDGYPDIKWEPVVPPRFDVRLFLGYVGFAVGVSMTVAPMAWVNLFEMAFK